MQFAVSGMNVVGMWFHVCVILRSLISIVTDYSFKLCEMSLHVVIVGLLRNVAKICTHTHGDL